MDVEKPTETQWFEYQRPCTYIIAFKSLWRKIYCCVTTVENGKCQSYLNCALCYCETH